MSNIQVADDNNDTGGELTAPVADPVTTALAEITNKNTTMTELAAKGRELALANKDVVFNVATTKGMDEAKKVRQAFREQVRYPMQELKKAGSLLLGTMQRQFNARAEELIAEVQVAEDEVHLQIEAEETRKAAAKRAADEAETARKAAHQESIAAISRMATTAAGMTSAELEVQLKAAQEIIVDDGYQEFQGQAQQAKDEVVRQLTGLLMAAKEDEAERAELEQQKELQRQRQAQIDEQQRRLEEAEREALERQEAQQREAAERQRLMDEQQAAIDRQRRELAEQAAAQQRARDERAAAIQRRIDGIVTMGTPNDGRALADCTSADLADVKAVLLAIKPTAEMYDDRAGEAIAARDQRYGEVSAAEKVAMEREEAEERQRRAEHAQELIDAIKQTGAPLAHRDSEVLKSTLHTLNNLVYDDELLDGRTEEARQAAQARILDVQAALSLKLAEEQREAEKADRLAREAAATLAARALVEAKRTCGVELYDMLREMVQGTWPGGPPVNLASLHERAKSMLQQINPNETFED